MRFFKLLTCLFLILEPVISIAQRLKSPEEFLQFETGSRFTYLHELTYYCDYLIKQQPSNFVRLDYGKTPEGRPLFVIIRSSEKNLKQLDAIQKAHQDNAPGQKLITWLSFNIHGDEASGTETAIQLLYQLANSDQFLDQIIVIDPCLNPDGRARYVNQANSHIGTTNFDPQDVRHREKWPLSRYNHYLADLNRDWCWAIQPETQQRLELFSKWSPHIHADFHEMGAEKTYFFPPPAEPVHELLFGYPLENTRKIGRNLASLFKNQQWDYFTEDEFDLLYPGYADSYAIFNGSLGLTLEQAGSADAGLFYIKQNGDTLTLADRISKHQAVAMSILQTAEEHKTNFISDYILFQKSSRQDSFYILKSRSTAYRNEIIDFFKRNHIEYVFVNEDTKLESFNLLSSHTGEQHFHTGDIVIPLAQKKSLLLRSLFEPHRYQPDQKTYDISSWTIPVLFHVETYKASRRNFDFSIEDPIKSSEIREAQILSFEYNTLAASKLVFAALKENLDVFIDTDKTNIYITHPDIARTIPENIIQRAKGLNIMASQIDQDWENFKQTSSLKTIEKPRIALLFDERCEETALGDFIFFLEKSLEFPFSKISRQTLEQGKLEAYNTLIISDGLYRNLTLNNDLLKRWIADGGRLILSDGAMEIAQQLKTEQIPRKNLNSVYYSKSRNEPVNLIQGCSFEVIMDSRSILSAGIPGNTHVILNKIPRFEIRSSGNTLSCYTNAGLLIDGYAGQNALNLMGNSFIFGTTSFGNGMIIQSAINPLFRNILMDGQMIVSNALLMPIR